MSARPSGTHCPSVLFGGIGYFFIRNSRLLLIAARARCFMPRRYRRARVGLPFCLARLQLVDQKIRFCLTSSGFGVSQTFPPDFITRQLFSSYAIHEFVVCHAKSGYRTQSSSSCSSFKTRSGLDISGATDQEGSSTIFAAGIAVFISGDGSFLMLSMCAYLCASRTVKECSPVPVLPGLEILGVIPRLTLDNRDGGCWVG